MECRMKVYTGAHVLNTFSPILGFDTGGGDAHLCRDAHHVYSDSHSVCQSQSTSTYLTPSPVSSNLSNSTIQPALPIQGISHDQTSIVPLSDSHSVCQSQSTSTYLTPSPVSSNLSNSTIQPASPIQDCVQSSMSTLSTDKNAVSQSPD